MPVIEKKKTGWGLGFLKIPKMFKKKTQTVSKSAYDKDKNTKPKPKEELKDSGILNSI